MQSFDPVAATYGSMCTHRHNAFLVPIIAVKETSPTEPIDGHDQPLPSRLLIVQNASEPVCLQGLVQNASVDDLEKVHGFEILADHTVLSGASIESVWQSLDLTKSGSIVKLDIYTEMESALPPAKGITPLFKWTQQHSNYGRMTGPWQLSLEDTIRDGARKAGRGFKLLLRYVNDDQLEGMQRAWDQGDHIMHFE